MMVDIPIQVHILRRSDGTGSLTIEQWNNVLANLNEYYADADLNFIECNQPNIINNDTYFDFDAADDQDPIVASEQVDNVINVYVPGGYLESFSGTSLCGYAYFPWSSNDLILTKASCMINGSTFAHEVGHYLGLYHTHGTSNCGSLTDELVDGSNCETRGDDVCDTPADPNLRGQECDTYLVDTDCNYTGDVVDANGDVFAPNPRNIMSYSRKACRDYFSPGQLARANFYATTSRSYLTCGQVVAPVNDLCEAAISISCGDTISGNTFNASVEQDLASCGTSLNSAPGIWYRIIGTGGEINISICDAAYDSKLAVFSGSCDSLNCVVGNDDSPDCGTGSEVSFASEANLEYYIYVTGFSDNRGAFVMNVNCESTPLTFSLGEANCVAAGDTIVFPITVSNFTNILNFQFSISLENPDIGQILSFNALNLPNPLNTTVVDSVTANMVWYSNNGLSLSNGDTIGLVSVLIGSAGSIDTSAIRFTDSPTPIYAENEQSEQLEILTGSGSISRCNTGTIAGQILREDGAPLANAIVYLSSGALMTAIDTTDVDGNYGFQNISFERDYIIRPEKDDNYINGVSAGDLVRILRHILSLEQLDSPYKYIAGDVSNPGTLNSGDLSRIRQLILGDIPAFPDVPSWQFVASDFVFPDPDAPTSMPFQSIININNFQEDATGLDFIAIKSGDVSNNANTSESQMEEIGFILSSEADPVINQSYVVDVKGVDFNNMIAAQYSISWDTSVLAFESISNTAPELEMNATNFSFNHADCGKLPWVWFDSDPVSLEDSTTLFSIRFTITGEVGDSIDLCFSQAPTSFFFENNEQELTATFSKMQTFVRMTSEVAKPLTSQDFTLYPNPTKDQFFLSATEVTTPLQLELFNMKGQLVKSWQQAISNNYFDVSELAKGVYQLRISNEKGALVKTLVVE